MESIQKEALRGLCHDDTIVMTKHVFRRCEERGIEYDSIKETILHGEIIERYPTDYPYPSCLLTYYIADSICLHVVVGVCTDRLWIITAYYPDKTKWGDDYKTRTGEANK